jgi:hypothetical protein
VHLNISALRLLCAKSGVPPNTSTTDTKAQPVAVMSAAVFVHMAACTVHTEWKQRPEGLAEPAEVTGVCHCSSCRSNLCGEMRHNTLRPLRQCYLYTVLGSVLSAARRSIR